MDFYSILEFCQLKAIALALDPTAESIFRIKCRQYSREFHTPLHLVYELNPMIVLGALYEDQFSPSLVEESGELEEVMDKLYTMQDPTYSRMSKQDLESMVDNVMNKELKRLSKDKPPTQEKISSEIKAAENKKPKSGGMDFGQLESLESQSEAGKNGFKE